MSFRNSIFPSPDFYQNWQAWGKALINWLHSNEHEDILEDPVRIPEYTVAGLPTASEWKAGAVMVTDESGGYTMAFSDGTNWRRVQDRAIVS